MKQFLIILLLISTALMAVSIYFEMQRALIALFSFLTGYSASIAIVVFIGKSINDHHISVIRKQEQDLQELSSK